MSCSIGSYPTMMFQKLVNKFLRTNPKSPDRVNASPVGETKASSGVLHRHPLLSNTNPRARSPIIVLFTFCGPSAVLWTVIAVYIFAIECVSVGASSHVSKKVREPIPSFTDRNSTASVVSEINVVGIKTSRLHLDPRPIFSPSSMAVSFFCQAAAAYWTSPTQIVDPRSFLFSADTSYVNHPLADFRSYSYYGEIMERLTDRIQCLLSRHHAQLRMSLRQSTNFRHGV